MEAPPASTGDGAREGATQSVLDVARTYERDRYLAALLAPAQARDDLLVLAAYFGELRRIPLLAHEPQIGEIRLQWWRDALGEFSAASGHPVADALIGLQQRRGLDPELVLAPIEGFSRELYEDGIRDARELQLYAGETDGAIVRLGVAVLGGTRGHNSAICSAGGRALALTRLALTLPQHLALGRKPVPADFLGSSRDPRGAGAEDARAATRVLLARLGQEARQELAEFRALQAKDGLGAALDAFLPLCLVEPYVRAVLAPGRDVLTEVADISPLSRVGRLWFAHWRGRV